MNVEKGLGAAGWGWIVGGVVGEVAIGVAAERRRGNSEEAQNAGAVLSRFRRVNRGLGDALFILGTRDQGVGELTAELDGHGICRLESQGLIDSLASLVKLAGSR